MSSKSYFKVTGTLFLIIAIVHLVRALNGWEVNLHTFEMPVGVSWAGLAIAGYLAYQGLSRK